MAAYRVTIASPMSEAAAFTYMSDLRNFREWDPGVRGVTQIAGEGGGPDAEFDVTVGGIGRDITLRYRTLRYQPPGEIVVEATHRFFTSTDRITVAPTPSGCDVTYDAGLKFNGKLGVLDFVAKCALQRIGKRAAAGLRRVLRKPEVT